MNEFFAFVSGLESYAWIIWLVLIALFLVIEMLSLDFTFLMLASGSTVGLLTAFAGVPIWGQFLIAAAAAGIFILFLRPPLLRRLRRGEDPTKSNVDALIGLPGTALVDVTADSGQVKLNNGDTWTARSADGTPILKGTSVSVNAINGATAVVQQHTESASAALPTFNE